MHVQALDGGIAGHLEVHLALSAFSKEFNFEPRIPAKCGEAGKLVLERVGITQSSARAATGERRSDAR